MELNFQFFVEIVLILALLACAVYIQRLRTIINSYFADTKNKEIIIEALQLAYTKLENKTDEAQVIITKANDEMLPDQHVHVDSEMVDLPSPANETLSVIWIAESPVVTSTEKDINTESVDDDNPFTIKLNSFLAKSPTTKKKPAVKKKLAAKKKPAKKKTTPKKKH